ncbi:unnamed protein product [Phytophthora fragariaefolia]|uniref:Unnamed protein product n=1 Tax=Phytophthora fragariaefolia TaxID=1490495 RepID=A0A9W6TWH5_9STRA|nr:unnamed protein product [Phytophthora fragariaefolia]
MLSPKLKPGVIKVFQEQLALWIYSTGMVFYKVEPQSLLDALPLLTPGIEVPSRDQLSTVLLDRAQLMSLKLLAMYLQGKGVPQLTKAVEILKSIGVNLKRLEDPAPISSVYKLFIDLPSEMEKTGLSSGELKAVETLNKTRFDFVYGDAHGLAYLLNPRYAGKGMDMLTRTAVEEFLGSWHGDDKTDEVVLELARLQTFLAAFKMKSKRRWQLMCDQKLPVYAGSANSHFSKLSPHRFSALQLQTRLRNATHRYIHSKLRNRLYPDRVKIIYFSTQRISMKKSLRPSHTWRIYYVANKTMKAATTTNPTVTMISCTTKVIFGFESYFVTK